MKTAFVVLLLLNSSISIAGNFTEKQRFEFRGSVKWNLTKEQFYNGCSDEDKKELLKFTDSGALHKCFLKYNQCSVLFNRITYAGVPYDANHGSVCDAISIAVGY